MASVQEDSEITSEKLQKSELLSESNTNIKSVETERRISSDFETVINLLKVLCGSSYITIPNCLIYTGWMGGLALFATTAVLNVITMRQQISIVERYPTLHTYP